MVVCVCNCVFVRTSIVPLGQFVCIIIYYAKSCVKIAVASFLLCPDLSPPLPSFLPCTADEVSQQILHMCMCVCVLSRQTFPFIKLSQQLALPPRGECEKVKPRRDDTNMEEREKGRREEGGKE